MGILVIVAGVMIFIIASAIFLLIRVSNFAGRIGNLEYDSQKMLKQLGRIDELERELLRLARAEKQAAAQDSKTALPEAHGREVVTPVPPDVAVEPAKPEAPIFAQLFPSSVQTATPASPSRSKEEWEALLGGRILNRIGALALVIGVGFFLKYAIDNEWISETVRILIGVTIGASCLAAGHRAHRKDFAIFGQGLIGAGTAILYLSVFAAFNFYHLLSPTLAFVCMAIVTAIAFLTGLRYDSLAIALLGWAGGFLTPVLLRTDVPNEVGLFTYLILLDVSLLGLLFRKPTWFVLEPLTLFGTWTIYLAWYIPHYTPELLGVTLVFVSVVWGLFYALEITRSGNEENGWTFISQVVPIFSLMFFYAALFILLDEHYRLWLVGGSVLLGGVYVLTLIVMSRRRIIEEFRTARYTLSAFLLLLIATAIHFSGMETVMFWAFEATLVVWCWHRWRHAPLLYAALAAYGLALLKLSGTEGVWSWKPIQEFEPILNERFLSFAVVISSLVSTSIAIQRGAAFVRKSIPSFVEYTGCLLMFLVFSLEINDYFKLRLMRLTSAAIEENEFAKLLTFSLAWGANALLLFRVGAWKRFDPLLFSGSAGLATAVALAMVRGAVFDPIETFTPILNYRALVMTAVALAIALQIGWLRRIQDTHAWSTELARVFQAALVILILVLVTSETRDVFQHELAMLEVTGSRAEEARPLQNLQQLSISGVWLVSSVLLMALGLWRKAIWLRYSSMLLFGVTILKIFTYDLSFLETFYRIISFVSLGLILLAVSYAYQRYKEVILGRS